VRGDKASAPPVMTETIACPLEVVIESDCFARGRLSGERGKGPLGT